MGMNRREREKERVTPMHARPTSTPYFHAKLVCAPRVRGDIERQLRSAWMRMFGKESPSKAGTDGRGEEGEDKQKRGEMNRICEAAHTQRPVSVRDSFVFSTRHGRRPTTRGLPSRACSAARSWSQCHIIRGARMEEGGREAEGRGEEAQR